jgi:hypothetical protein
MADTSTLFSALSNRTRRRLLVQLCDRATVRVPDELLVRGSVGARSPQSDPISDGGVAEDPPSSFMIRLRHNHLPRLEDAGYIEWDREEGTVSRGPAFGEVEPAIRLLSANADRLPSGLL